MTGHRVVSSDEWVAERKALLAREKEFTRLRDELSRERRELPWRQIQKRYLFEGPLGEVTLGELFEGRSQLVVYHFMFAPDWDAGCKSCSFWVDTLDRQVIHLNHRDVSVAAISRAPLDKLEAYRDRMGWSIKWVSSGGSDFNYDFHVSFTQDQIDSGEIQYNYGPSPAFSPDAHGISVFFKDTDGAIYHTYSTFGRGLDMTNGAYQYLDLVPRGRDESDGPMSWLRRRDEYDDPE